ncbi:MAG: LLM class flavin-dependent oxidoreductase, partial [Rhodospirillaceae bacterium]|nr:LLM class flavin-dependent oxidoreductase [Rhodospirillaceae bacterium]
IPIWFGGHADAVMRRVARIGDGWFPIFAMDDKGKAELDKLHRYIEEAGRNPADIGIESFVNAADKSEDQLAREIAAWKQNGASHISLNTMGAGFTSLQEHIDAVERFRGIASDV